MNVRGERRQDPLKVWQYFRVLYNRAILLRILPTVEQTLKKVWQLILVLVGL